MSVESSKEISQYLTFKLEDDLYALNVEGVREVLELELNHITKIPRTPESLRGVINVRGSVVPVIDMRIKFNMEKQETTIDTCIIVIETTLSGKTTILGILADSVQEVIDLELDQIEAAPEIGNQLRTEFIAGIGKRDDSFIIILKIDEILTAEELSVVDTPAHHSSDERQPSREQDKTLATVSAV